MELVTAPVDSTAARSVTTLDRGILLLCIAVPLLTVAGPGGGKSSPVSGDAPSPLGGYASSDKGPSAAPGKGSAGDAVRHYRSRG